MKIEDTPQDVAISKLSETKAKSQEVKKQSQEIGSSAQQINDLASSAIDVIRLKPQNVDYEDLIDRTEQINRQLDSAAIELTNVDASLLYAAVAANTVMSSVMISASFGPDASERRIEQTTVVDRLRQVVARVGQKEQLVPLMQRFGLDRPHPGNRSPIEQLDTAWAAFSNPVTPNSPASTSLVPMRECIEESILLLLSRRPRVETASSWGSKIRSIANQLSRDALSQDEIQSLVNDWQSLEQLLSASKRNAVTRENWQDIFRKANSFLYEFLLALEPNKMRKSGAAN